MSTGIAASLLGNSVAGAGMGAATGGLGSIASSVLGNSVAGALANKLSGKKPDASEDTTQVQTPMYVPPTDQNVSINAPRTAPLNASAVPQANNQQNPLGLLGNLYSKFKTPGQP